MPKLTRKHPKLSRDGRDAVVDLGGRRHYCGPWGSPKAEEAYDRFIAEWLNNGRELPARTAQAGKDEVTVTKVAVAYLKCARQRYVRDAASTNVALWHVTSAPQHGSYGLSDRCA